jgi:hypothetical protein
VVRETRCGKGIDPAKDYDYPDLAFALPTPPIDPIDEQVVSSVMEYHGSNDRKRADEIRSSYDGCGACPG